MKYVSNKQKAIAHIASLPLDDELKEHLQAVVSKHAIDNCAVEVSVDDENVTLLFEADHDLYGSAVLNNYVVDYATIDKKVTVVTIKKTSIQGNTMNTQENTINANESASAHGNDTCDCYWATKEERRKFLENIQTCEKAAKPVASETGAAKSKEDTELATKIGKGVLYAVGAVAVVTGGFFAWKKWGSSSNAS
jgi:hypothetical protein